MNPRLSLDLLDVVLIKVATMMHCKQTSGGSAGEDWSGSPIGDTFCLSCMRGTREEISGARQVGGPSRLRHDARPHREAAQLYTLRSSTYAYTFYTVDETDTDSMHDDRAGSGSGRMAPPPPIYLVCVNNGTRRTAPPSSSCIITRASYK